MLIQSLIGGLLLAGVHVFAGRLTFLEAIPRSRWLSLAGGVGVSYALMHLLPELVHYQVVLGEQIHGRLFAQLEERAVWLLLLLGLVVFYGLEQIAQRRDDREGESAAWVFWIHIGSYGLYNALLGYLLIHEDRGLVSLSLFLLGIGLHFVVNDHALQQHHPVRYRKLGRWALAGAVLIGWVVGAATAVHPVVIAGVISFLAGGIILNTFKEELPKERESRYWAFVVGSLGYAAVLLAF